jgi:TRAP-type mannitol/chloroaromatic compound transport system permease small subunit
VGYIRNTHVRIDVVTTQLKPRTHAWLELLGCILFAIPYTVIAIYFSADFAWISFVDNEGSESANGLPYRWIPKGFLFVGLVLLLAGVLSVLMRVIVFLFGPERLGRAAEYGAVRMPS